MTDEYTERGLAVFARVEIGGDGYDPIVDFTVQESSLATERRVWIGKGEHRGHLTEQQARAVRDALSEFLGDEDPLATPLNLPPVTLEDGSLAWPGDPRFAVRVRTVYGALPEQIVEAHSLVDALTRAAEIPLTDWMPNRA